MALSLAQFRAKFAEFAAASDPLVQEALDEASDELDPDVWGSRLNAGHGWLTAHILTESGYGKQVPKDGTTTFGRRFEELAKRVGRSARLVLD